VVKGISRQVIVVQSPDKELFDQAIFILKDGKSEVSDDMLLKEAKALIQNREEERGSLRPLLWASCGAAVTGAVWLLTAMF
jgi:hypothetical protein